MLPIWVPEITFGNAICITVLVFVYFDLRSRVGKNLDGIIKVDSSAILAATHSKMSFDTSATNSAAIAATAASTAAEIANAVVSITAAAADAAAAVYTPVATKLPAELRVTIAKELKTPPAPAGQ